jgi:DNA polymerase III subunit chi
MTERVDFYILNSAGARQRWLLACRLAEKAFMQDMSVFIVNDTPADAQALDDLLWTFNDRSFIPHKICRDAHSMDLEARVHLTDQPAVPAAADLLVNLSTRLPADWERCGRIAEIVDADEEHRRLGRERFKTYRDLKVTLETHQLNTPMSEHG